MRADELLIISGRRGFEAEVARKPSGAIIIEGQHVCDTTSCAHCGHHWIPIKGSGITRGWCHNCNGPLCGCQECFECMDFRKRMDLYEKQQIKILR